MRDVAGKVAVVTGAASGIGRGMAESFAAAGMKVVLADVEEDALAKTAEALRGTGADVHSVVTDVSKAEQVQALADESLKRFGAVHVVCNNAGVGGDFGPSWEQTPESWEWTLGVNLWGVIHGVRAFVPRMIEQHDEGHVVNTASLAGLTSLPMVSPYHASKFAVVTLTESLHYELQMAGSKVRASVLCPGFVRTQIMESDRNRPSQLLGPDRPGSEMEQAWQEGYRQMVEEGMDPAQVADVVLDAIRSERFWVFPHPEWLDGVRSRMEDIVEQRNPELHLPEDFQSRLRL